MSAFLNEGLFTSNTAEWATPQDFFDKLNKEFHFTLDPCSTDENAKCEKHYTKEQDGLQQDWTGETVFCNPPYGKGIAAWCKKCYEHSLNGGTAVMLVHSRTDTAWFHDWVYGKAELRFVRGRLHFGGAKWNAPFPSMVAIYRPEGQQKKILDATCGDRTMWFQKQEPHTVYCDKRREEHAGVFGKNHDRSRHLVINPDIQCDFTNLPFQDNSFSLVVFDPPHSTELTEKSWLAKQYGRLEGDWRQMIKAGFDECMRVLKPEGVLIFKWSDINISTRDIIKVIGQEPLFGHRSGRKMNTHWMTFMKFTAD